MRSAESGTPRARAWSAMSTRRASSPESWPIACAERAPPSRPPGAGPPRRRPRRAPRRSPPGGRRPRTGTAPAPRAADPQSSAQVTAPARHTTRSAARTCAGTSSMNSVTVTGASTLGVGRADRLGAAAAGLVEHGAAPRFVGDEPAPITAGSVPFRNARALAAAGDQDRQDRASPCAWRAREGVLGVKSARIGFPVRARPLRRTGTRAARGRRRTRAWRAGRGAAW